MQSVGTVNTGPELAVRRFLHQMGYRYRLHAKNLPGRPDIVFASRKKVIFVHGCFWHNHGCDKGRPPKSRLTYWGPKLTANRERDKAQRSRLEALGWGVLTIWQCETRDLEKLSQKLDAFLGNGRMRKRAAAGAGH